jgi:Zn-dependent M16 (insulinase) family peptidase
LSEELTALRTHLLTASSLNLLTVSDSQNCEASTDQLRSAAHGLTSAGNLQPWSLSESVAGTNQIWAANTQVNFCARAYPTVSSGHPDAPILSVLAAYLRNGFLHRSIREQGGAYGGGASHDGNVGAFRFFSYRDPRNLETLADFDASIAWVLSAEPDSLALEEAILSVISSLDKPASPSGEVKKAFYDGLYGRTADHKRALRESIVSTTLEDLRRVANTYLNPEFGCSVILTDPKTAASPALVDLGWTHHDLA